MWGRLFRVESDLDNLLLYPQLSELYFCVCSNDMHIWAFCMASCLGRMLLLNLSCEKLHRCFFLSWVSEFNIPYCTNVCDLIFQSFQGKSINAGPLVTGFRPFKSDLTEKGASISTEVRCTHSWIGGSTWSVQTSHNVRSMNCQRAASQGFVKAGLNACGLPPLHSVTWTATNNLLLCSQDSRAPPPPPHRAIVYLNFDLRVFSKWLN